MPRLDHCCSYGVAGSWNIVIIIMIIIIINIFIHDNPYNIYLYPADD